MPSVSGLRLVDVPESSMVYNGVSQLPVMTALQPNVRGKDAKIQSS